MPKAIGVRGRQWKKLVQTEKASRRPRECRRHDRRPLKNKRRAISCYKDNKKRAGGNAKALNAQIKSHRKLLTDAALKEIYTAKSFALDGIDYFIDVIEKFIFR